MQKRRRQSIRFETLEGRLLLSGGTVDPAWAVIAATKPAKPFVLDTKPYVYVFVTAHHLRDNSYYQNLLDFGDRKQAVGSMGKADTPRNLSARSAARISYPTSEVQR